MQMQVTFSEGTPNGVPTIRARTRTALNLDHAVKLCQEALEARGNLGLEPYAAEWLRGAYEVWFARPGDWN